MDSKASDRAARPAAVHLLLGEEARLRDRRAREIVESLGPIENPDYNREVFRGPDVDLDRVVLACEMLPFIAERRLVVVWRLDLKAAAAHTGLMDYLRRPNPSTVLVLVADPTSSEDGGGRGAAKKGASPKDLMALVPAREEFPALRPDAAREVVRRAAKERGLELDPDFVSELLDRVGLDAARLEDEIEKAGLMAGDRRRIGAADLDKLTRRTRPHTLFELTDAVAAGDREGTLRHVAALMEDGVDALAMIGMLGWHLRRTLRGAAALEAGRSPRDAAQAAQVYRHGDRFAASCRALGTAGTARAVRALSEADRAIKSTPEAPRVILERTLLGLMPRER
jgi:DNA polymerase-3 subunit delta